MLENQLSQFSSAKKKRLLSPSSLQGPWWITRSTLAWLCGSFCLCFAIAGNAAASCHPAARWDPLPLTEWTNWVCRWRNKASCRLLQLQARPLICINCRLGCHASTTRRSVRYVMTHTVPSAKHTLGFQDCIYGMRRCLSGACMPFQPCLVTVAVSCLFPYSTVRLQDGLRWVVQQV